MAWQGKRKEAKTYSREDFSPTERIILLALARAAGRKFAMIDHLWVQKVTFLFRRLLGNVDESQSPEAAGYIAYDLGPYSEEVEGALSSLCDDHLVEVSQKRELGLTSAGGAVATQIATERLKGVKAMDSILDLLEDLSPQEIILYVYATSPEWTKASKISYVLADREARMQLARKLYGKERVSAEKAAEIAGIPLHRFIEMLTGDRRR